MPRASLIRPGLIAVLAALAIAAGIAGCSGEPLAESEAPRAGEDSVSDVSQTSGGDAAAAIGVGGEGGALTLPQLAERKIIRTATLELGVENVGAAVQEVEDIATAASGFVSGSSVFIEEPPEGEVEDNGEPRRTQTATVTIRVPAEAYRNVVSQLRGIAEEVKSESSEASEVTEEFTDLQARLRNLEATEASYLELLTEAETIPDILTVQDRINSVRLEIEQVQGRINVLDSLTELATITVRLKSLLAAVEEPGGGEGWAEEAWDAAWQGSQDALVALGTIAIVGGVVLIWLAIPALVVLFGWRRFGWRLGPRPPQSGEAGGPGAPVSSPPPGTT